MNKESMKELAKEHRSYIVALAKNNTKLVDVDVADAICIGEFYRRIIFPKKEVANASK